MRKYVLACVALLVACSKAAPDTKPAAPSSSSAVAVAPIDAGVDGGETAFQRIAKLEAMGDAIEFVRADVEISGVPRDGGHAVGPALFSLWANDRMQWSDVAVSKDETSYPLVVKDTKAAIGKRMCVVVRIDVIRAMHTKDEPRTMYAVYMRSNEGAFFAYAAGSTESVVDRGGARFCGVVMGRQARAGVDGSEVVLVGMFDLPENRSQVDASP